MNTFLNNLLFLVKQKNFLFIALPFGLILLFIIFTIILFQPSPNNQQSQNTTPTPTTDENVSTPNEQSSVTFTPEQTVDPTGYEKAMQEQAKNDEQFAKEEEAIREAYPWFDNLPLQTDDYFVYFDAEKKSFIALLYPKTSSQTSVDDQVTDIKSRISLRLKKLLDVDLSKYPVEWQINPE
jgi:hypothetical protein